MIYHTNISKYAGVTMETQITIKISNELLERTKTQADKQSRSIASVIREALIIYLANQR